MTNKEFVQLQWENATWDNTPFAQKVARKLLEVSVELGLKGITKAYIGRGKAGYQTTCISFPHINLHVQTSSIRNKEQLKVEDISDFNVYYPKEADIFVIQSDQGLEEVENQIEEVIKVIKERMTLLPQHYVPWEIEQDYNYEGFNHPGKIHINDGKCFRRVTDILSLFGDPVEACMRGGKAHKYIPNTDIWWPKFYTTKDGWINTLYASGKTITEKNADSEENRKLVNKYLEMEEHYKIVFTSVKEADGEQCYMFKGVFKLDKDYTNEKNGGVFRKIADETLIYKL